MDIIKELADRAFDIVWDSDTSKFGPSTHIRPDGFEEKFAQLIATECISIAQAGLAPAVVTVIKERFGIK